MQKIEAVEGHATPTRHHRREGWGCLLPSNDPQHRLPLLRCQPAPCGNHFRQVVIARRSTACRKLLGVHRLH